MPISSRCKELIAYAKANPGKLNFGSAGNGTSHHLVGELFKIQTGTDITHVPYKGAGPMMQDLLAGQVDMAFDGMGTSAAADSRGQAPAARRDHDHALADPPRRPDDAGSGHRRLRGDDVVRALGDPGTPQPIIDRMFAEVAKVLQMPDIKDIWATQGAVLGGMPPAEFDKLVKSEIAKWGKVVKDAGIKIDL